MNADCEVCATADATGSWGQAGTHCRRCHRSWESKSQAHCNVCHEQFASNGVADLHWVKGNHVHPSTLPKRLRTAEEAFGVVWRRTGDGRSFPSALAGEDSQPLKAGAGTGVPK